MTIFTCFQLSIWVFSHVPHLRIQPRTIYQRLKAKVKIFKKTESPLIVLIVYFKPKLFTCFQLRVWLGLVPISFLIINGASGCFGVFLTLVLVFSFFTICLLCKHILLPATKINKHMMEKIINKGICFNQHVIVPDE